MRVEEENPGRRVSGLENWGTVRKQGRGFFGVGSQAPPPPAAHTQPTRKMSRRNEWMGKGGAAQVLGCHQAFPSIISVTPSFCFSRRDHRRVHQGERLRPGGGAAGPGRGAAAPRASRGGLPEHRHPGPRGAPAPGHAAALELPPGAACAPGAGPRAATAPGHHRAAQAARHALPLRVRGPLRRQHPRGEQHRGQQDAARHRGEARGWVSRLPAPPAPPLRHPLPRAEIRAPALLVYFTVVIIIAVAIVVALHTLTRLRFQRTFQERRPSGHWQY